MERLDERTKADGGNVCVWFDWDGERWVFNSAEQEYREAVRGMSGTVSGGYDPSPDELRLFAAALALEAERIDKSRRRRK